MNNDCNMDQIMNDANVYKHLFSNIHIGIMNLENSINLLESKVTFINTGFTKITGYTLEDIHTFFEDNILNLILEEDREDTLQEYHKQISEENTFQLTYRIKSKYGTELWILDSGCTYIDEQGRACSQSVFTDITTIKNQEEELKASEERFRISLSSTNAAIFEVDLVHQAYTHFENAERIFGVSGDKILSDVHSFRNLSPEEYLEAASDYFCHPDDKEIVANAFDKINHGLATSYEARMKVGDSKYVWCKIDVTPILNKKGLPTRMIGRISDINELKIQTNLLEKKIQIDTFTGLYNKTYTEIVTTSILKENSNKQHALLFLDIDNFKTVNDTFGHDCGDRAIKAVSKQLKSLFRSSDIIGRVGGDEFIVFMQNIASIDVVIEKAKKLNELIRNLSMKNNPDYKLSVSIGIALYSEHGNTYPLLFKAADLALYGSKQKGKDCFSIYNGDPIPNETEHFISID